MRRYAALFHFSVLISVIAHSATAQTARNDPGWFFGYADAGYGIHACAPDAQIDTSGQPYQTCLSLYCEAGFGVSLGLRTGFTVFPGAFTAYVSVDGKTGMPLAMTPQPNGIYPIAELNPANATALFRTLSSGQTLSIVTSKSGVQPPGLLTFPLQGAAQALGAMNAECLLGQPNGSVVLLTEQPAPLAEATPDSDPARFVKTSDVASQDGRGMALARALLAGRIAEAEAEVGRPIEVIPELIPFQDGRQLMIVYLCDATWFGITGCETWMFTATAGAAQFNVSAAEYIGAGPHWIDLKSGVDGWPDLLSQPHTGKGAFARARWNGTKY